MKLLFLLQDLPYPPSNGYRQKIYNLLNHVAQHHDCDLLVFGTPADQSVAQPWLDQIPRLRVLGVFSPDRVPFLRVRQFLQFVSSFKSPVWLRFRSEGFRNAIRNAMAGTHYDVVHLDLQGMAQYCSILGSTKRVLSLNDAMSATLFDAAANRHAPLLSRISWFLQAWHQLGVDKSLFSLADAVHFVGKYDLEWCEKNLKVRNGVYIPLAVDPVFLNNRPQERHDAGVIRLLIIDKLWAPQHLNAVKEFLMEHWSEIHSRHPGTELTIIGGKGMPAEFVEYVKSIPGLRLYDWVERLEETLDKADIAIFPYAVAVGMKTRVLQCMASRAAVIGTRNAFLGLPVENKKNVYEAEDMDAMARGVEYLLTAPSLRTQIAQSARVVIEENFTQDIIGTAWERLYSNVSRGDNFIT